MSPSTREPRERTFSMMSLTGMSSGQLGKFHNAGVTILLLFMRTSKLPFLVSSYLNKFELCRLYIHGGNDIRDGPMDNIWAIDMAKIRNQVDHFQNSPTARLEGYSWEQIGTVGESPGPVTYHQAFVIGHYMYIIGGSYLKSKQDTQYRLDLKMWKWEAFKVKGANNDTNNLPVSIDEHSACINSQQN